MSFCYWALFIIWALVALANIILLGILFFVKLICDWVPSIRCWIDDISTKLYNRKHHKNQILVQEGKCYRWVDVIKA